MIPTNTVKSKLAFSLGIEVGVIGHHSVIFWVLVVCLDSGRCNTIRFSAVACRKLTRRPGRYKSHFKISMEI